MAPAWEAIKLVITAFTGSKLEEDYEIPLAHVLPPKSRRRHLWL